MARQANRPVFVVMPEFNAPPDARAGFVDAACDAARHFLYAQPGCRQFEIIVPDEPHEPIVFYQVYDDRESFEHHRNAAHTRRLRDAMHRFGVTETEVRYASRAYPRTDSPNIMRWWG